MKRRLSLEERRAIKAKGWVVNVAETAAQIIFKKRGIGFVRRGYPDFTIIKNDEIVGFIEVKPNRGKALRKDQVRFARFCEHYAIPFMKWTPEDGEEAIVAFAESL